MRRWIGFDGGAGERFGQLWIATTPQTREDAALKSAYAKLISDNPCSQCTSGRLASNIKQSVGDAKRLAGWANMCVEALMKYPAALVWEEDR